MVSVVRTIWFTILWILNDFLGGRPSFVKMKVLSEFSIPDYPWIETGTFKVDTSLLLSRISDQVITIKPDTKLYQGAVKRFRGNDSITDIHGESETELRKVT